jgi:DNA-binding PucR family transcriptional regulator
MPEKIQAETRVLEMLAAGTLLEAILEEIAGLSEQGFDAGEIEDLRAAAIAVNARQESDRRRLRGMDVLDATVADLAGLLDSDQVLEAICRRSRWLLGTDVAYVTIIDPDRGDTYVHSTDGIGSEAFRHMRLGLGVGLGGLVARDGVSATTSDYAADDRFAHTEDIDGRVLAEGLRAIIGVPLVRRQEVIGVLMSGSRSVRSFDPTEMALFEALATHAALAIENARLFEAAQSSLERLERAEEESRAAADLHQLLATLAVEGASSAQLSAAVAEAVGGRLELVERSEQPVEPAAPEPAARIPLNLGAEQLGELVWFSPAEAETDRELELLRRCAPIVAGQLFSESARSDTQYRRRSDLVKAIFDDPAADADALHHEASRVGIDLDAEHVVLVAEPPRGLDRWAALLAGREATGEGGAAGIIGARLVVLAPGADPATTAERWTSLLSTSDGSRPTIGASAPVSGLQAIKGGRSEAAAALGLARALGRRETTVHADEAGLFMLVFVKGDPGLVRRFVEEILAPLNESDAERGRPVLTSTLKAYLDNSGQLSTTAREMGVHVNTVYQRLERIDKLLGADWRTPDRRLELQLALRAADLLDSAPVG